MSNVKPVEICTTSISSCRHHTGTASRWPWFEPDSAQISTWKDGILNMIFAQKPERWMMSADLGA